uniref:FAM161 centrosomal protein B n=1 Tax=Sinocyclocheilus grahami TaxID=75366 RepID=A0A672N7U2_SINGR
MQPCQGGAVFQCEMITMFAKVLSETNSMSSTLVLSSKVILRNFTSNGVEAPRTTGSNSLGTVTERQRKPLPPDSQKAKEEAGLTECQKQFCVAPVPEHVSKPLYDDLIHEQERLRKEGREQRRDFLFTTQKPFRFHKREEKKRERLKEEMASANKSEKNRSSLCEKTYTESGLRQEQQRKICIHPRAQETLKVSSAPIQRQEPRADRQTRSAQKNKSKMLGFFDQKLSFRPKTNAAMPDFDKLYQAFQRKAMEAAERRDVTHCKPFQLLTFTLHPHSFNKSTDKMNLKRSSSFGGLTSLSMDTLPTYITDAARKRSMAVRRSLELNDLKEQENAKWMKQHRINSQSMSRAVAMRAQAMDPHKSLKEVYQEKLKKHRYRNTLKQAGLDEHLVRSKGETNMAIHVDNDCADEDHYSTESETQKRYEDT